MGAFWDCISKTADVQGILGFIISVIIWTVFEQFKRSYENQKVDFNKEQKETYNNLMQIQQNIYSDGLLDKRRCGELRQLMFLAKRRYKKLLTIRDKYHMRQIFLLLKNPPEGIDRTKLSIHIDYYIARFHKKEK